MQIVTNILEFEYVKLKRHWPWYLVGLFIFWTVPGAINDFKDYQLIVVQENREARIEYYETAPVEEFYKLASIKPSDVCQGDATQQWISSREVYQTDTGWDARLVRELNSKDVTVGKVYEEFIPAVTIEPRDGESVRIQKLPEDLEVGTYFWQLAVTLYLPMGVERHDVPLFNSETFEVRDCTDLEQPVHDVIEDIVSEFN